MKKSLLFLWAALIIPALLTLISFITNIRSLKPDDIEVGMTYPND